MTRYPDPLLIALILLFISWPVLFFLIRRYTKANDAWKGWRHLAFWLGPIGAWLILAWLKLAASEKTNVDEKSIKPVQPVSSIRRQSVFWILGLIAVVAVAEGTQSHLFSPPTTLAWRDIMVNVVREDSGQINRYTGRTVIVEIPGFGDVHFPAGTEMRAANAACHELYLQTKQHKQR